MENGDVILLMEILTCRIHNIQEQGIIDLNEFKRWAWEVLDEFIIRNQN